MENNIFGSFEDYLETIKMVVKNNREENNEIGRSLREIHFLENEVDANFEYFRECYDGNESPQYVVANLRFNENDLFRKIDNITDECILSEVNTRFIADDVISSADTDDLEDEILERWDKTLVNPDELEVDELLDLLEKKDGRRYYGDNKKDIICELLGFNNSFGYTVEEAIEEIKKIW
jgi:hypothetical protein